MLKLAARLVILAVLLCCGGILGAEESKETPEEAESRVAEEAAEEPVEEPTAETPGYVRVTGEFGKENEIYGFIADGLMYGDLELELPGVIGTKNYDAGRDGIPFVQAKGAIDPLTGHLFCTLNSPVSDNPRVRLHVSYGIYDVDDVDEIRTGSFYGHDPNEERRVFDFDFKFAEDSKRLMLATATGAAELIAAECRGDGTWVKDFARYPFKPDYQIATCLMVEDVQPVGSDLVVLVSLREKRGFDGGIYLGGFSADTLSFRLVRLSQKKNRRPVVVELGEQVPMPRFNYPKEDPRLPALLEDFGSLRAGEGEKVIAEIWNGSEVLKFEAERNLTGLTALGPGDEANIPLLALLKALDGES